MGANSLWAFMGADSPWVLPLYWSLCCRNCLVARSTDFAILPPARASLTLFKFFYILSLCLLSFPRANTCSLRDILQRRSCRAIADDSSWHLRGQHCTFCCGDSDAVTV